MDATQNHHPITFISSHLLFTCPSFLTPLSLPKHKCLNPGRSSHRAASRITASGLDDQMAAIQKQIEMLEQQLATSGIKPSPQQQQQQSPPPPPQQKQQPYTPMAPKDLSGSIKAVVREDWESDDNDGNDTDGGAWRRPDGTYQVGMRIPIAQEFIDKLNPRMSVEERFNIMNEGLMDMRERRAGPQAAESYMESFERRQYQQQQQQQQQGMPPPQAQKNTPPPPPSQSQSRAPAAGSIAEKLKQEHEWFQKQQQLLLDEHKRRIDAILSQSH